MENRDFIRKQFAGYLDGTLSEEEAEALLAYLQSAEDPGFVQSLIEEHFEHPLSRELSRDLAVRKRLDQSHQRITAHIHGNTDSNPHSGRSVLVKALAIAATIAILIAGTLFFRPSGPAKTVVAFAPKGTTRQLTLPDSSKVWLNAGTTLEYPEHFTGNTRSVILRDGQAFFDVRHDAAHPFVVRAARAAVTVYGTSFEVSDFKEDHVSGVMVKTGKVGVTSSEWKGDPSMLLPGEKLAMDHLTHTRIKSLVPSTDIAEWRENKLTFNQTPFADVMNALQRKYNVTIEVRNPSLLHEKITLRLENEPLDNVMQVLGLSNNFKYTIHEQSVIVK